MESSQVAGGVVLATARRVPFEAGRAGREDGARQTNGAFGPAEGAFGMDGARDAGETDRSADETGGERDTRSPPPNPYDDPFEIDGRGRTPLILAAERGLMDVVHTMIFRLSGTGMCPVRLTLIAKRDHAGLTAADRAEQNGHTEIVRLLRSEQGRMEYFE